MTRNTCEICGKEIVGFIECPHYDYKDFPLELALGDLTMETNEYIAALESSPYSRYLVEKETLPAVPSNQNNTPSQPKNTHTVPRHTAFNSNDTSSGSGNTSSSAVSPPSDENSGITLLQRLAFLNIERDRMPTPLFLRM